MTARKDDTTTTVSLGTVVDLSTNPTEVIRPDGALVTVSGSAYVLDVPGPHLVGGTVYTAE